MAIDEAAFRRKVEAALKGLLRQLDGVDPSGEELDIKYSDGVLQIDFERGGTFILSQQVPVQELWLSAQRRAWHFQIREAGWVERDSGESLVVVLSTLFSQKLDRTVALKAPST